MDSFSLINSKKNNSEFLEKFNNKFSFSDRKGILSIFKSDTNNAVDFDIKKSYSTKENNLKKWNIILNSKK